MLGGRDQAEVQKPSIHNLRKETRDAECSPCSGHFPSPTSLNGSMARKRHLGHQNRFGSWVKVLGRGRPQAAHRQRKSTPSGAFPKSKSSPQRLTASLQPSPARTFEAASPGRPGRPQGPQGPQGPRPAPAAKGPETARGSMAGSQGEGVT